MCLLLIHQAHQPHPPPGKRMRVVPFRHWSMTAADSLKRWGSVGWVENPSWPLHGCFSRWWQLKYFWNFHPGNWGFHDPIWRAYFSKGLVQPPTSFLKRPLAEKNPWFIWELDHGRIRRSIFRILCYIILYYITNRVMIWPDILQFIRYW